MLRSRPAPASRSFPVQAASGSRTKVLKATLFSTLLLTLAACGGGGGSSGSFSGNGQPSSTPPSTGPSTTPVTPPTPVYQIGDGSGSSYQDGKVNASQTTLLSGESATLRVNVVNTASNNEPPTTSQNVTFRSTCSANGRASFGAVNPVSNGLYSVQYTNSGCDGPDTVTATLTAGTTTDTATVAMTMVGPQVLTVSFVSSTHDQLSLAGIGGNESTELTFKVAGPQGVPIIGKQVNFSINTTVGGASILAGRESGITDQDGLARTVLNSGTVAGPVSVRAVHAESGKQGSSADIIISTGVPVSDRFSLTYGPFNPVGAYNTDGVQVGVNIIASDVFGNNPTDGTRVSFVAPESGNIQNSCTLVDGACSVTWRSTSPRPANMRVEIIAYTDGAENFVDRNGNSLYDSADGAVTDLGEPFADENENGAYDQGEFFFDTNRNGVRNGGNGLWDGPCLDKVNAAAVCTGESTIAIYKTVRIVMPTDSVRILQQGNFPAVGTTISVANGASISFGGMILADSNTNADPLGSNPPPIGTTITFAIGGGGATILSVPSFTVPNTIAPVGPFGVTVAAGTVRPGDPLPTNVFLQMNIQVPGRTGQQFAWPLTIL
jgi:hypothetical protein